MRGGDGAEVIYALRNNDTLSKLILSELESEGQNIRKAYQRRLPSDPTKDYYFMQRNTADTESVTVEYGFLDSKADDVQQLKNNWQKYAEAVVRAVTRYAGIPYQINTDGDFYIVKSGDSLWSIAKKYDISVDELKTFNNLSSNLLSIGQQLQIPQEENQSQTILYTVKSGDTLYNIANNYNAEVSDIMRLNNLSTNLLSIGQQLIIPTEQIDDYTNGGTYVVKSGDTLYGIANQYNTTVSNLKTLNNLTSNTLTIGQILNVPLVSSITTYTVQNGDTLYGIANRFNTTVTSLINKNNLTSNTLKIGQVLTI